ncbi:MAG TPA: CpaF family protein [Planctomycetaceae bacterium]|jgi:pilus assembly protein CpaF|nr:CpaF family protein [Planctomycetaceae bacterium]
MNQEERERLINEIIDEILGLGPIDPLLRDPTISDILINGPRTVYVERRGRLERTNVAFHDEQHLLEIVQRIASRVGRRLDESSPMVDARLPDGSRVNAVIRPLALDGALVSIRRFSTHPLLASDLIARKSATPDMMEFLAACVRSRLNILISGGTGSGKTTFLNMLSGYIADDERIATIEDAAELQLQQPHVARMETRPPNLEGKGEVATRDLVKNALRMRPDRIIIGECRGSEAFDMLQAMTTGHDGSLTTIHANSTRDAISRLEMLVGMAGFDLPIWFIHRQIASAIDIVVQCARLTGGARKVIQISEVTGAEGEVINMHDLFLFEQTSLDENKIAQGHYKATGLRPTCLERLEACGQKLDPGLFERRILELNRLDSISHSSVR